MSEARKTPNRVTFPQILHNILTQAATLGVDKIISWDEEGSKFTIYNENEFVLKVLPKHFKQSKYSSFRRQLNAYGFERVSSNSYLIKKYGSTTISYIHKDFMRDYPNACKQIKRRYASQTLRDRVSKLDANTIPGLKLFDPREAFDCSTLPNHEYTPITSGNDRIGAAPTSTTGHNDTLASDLMLDEMLSTFDTDKLSCEDWNPQKETLSNLIDWDPFMESFTSTMDDDDDVLCKAKICFTEPSETNQ